MKFFDRVKTTTTTASTGPITCSAAAVSSELRTLAGAGGVVGDVFPYAIGIAGSAEWECGLGTITAISSGAVTFSRTPTASSNGNALVNFSAGSKEVICTPFGATLTKWEKGTSPRVVYLSNYCTSDTDLSMYSQKAGIDQRAIVQAVLDLAKTWGSLHLVWDVKITLANVPGTDDTLLASSNTTVVALNGCGALQAAGSKGDMWKNANPTTNQNNNWMAINDENITIDGGIWHGNREGQTVKMDVFRFVGVRNLRTRNYKIVRPTGMCFRTINIDGLINEHYTLDQGVDNLTAANSGYAGFVNTDGMHHHGPYRNGYDNNGTILNCGDDSYALNADDAWGEATFTGRFDNVWGPMENITVKNLTIRARLFGMRLLSGGSPMSNIRIKNVKGSTGGYGLVIDNYITPSKCNLPGDGGFRDIEIDGWHMTNTVFNPNADWYQMSMHINAKVEQLVMKNIIKSDFNNIYFPIIRFGEKYKGDQLSVELSSRNYNGGTWMTEQIDFAPGATVTQADIKVRTYSSSAINGSPVRVQAGATISQLTLEGQAPNFTSMLNNQGTIAALLDRSSASAVVAPTSTWTLQSGSPWAEDVNSPGKLTLTTNHAGVVDSVKKKTADANGGNVKMVGTIRFNGPSVGGGLHAAFIVRGANMVPWSAVTQGYAVDMFLESGGGIKLFKVTGSTQPQMGAQLTVPFAVNIDYAIALVAKTVSGTTTISVTVQRGSDGLYLQTNGSWGSSAVPAISVTDTSIPAAAGEWGVYAFNDNNPNVQVQFNGLDIVAAP